MTARPDVAARDSVHVTVTSRKSQPPGSSSQGSSVWSSFSRHHHVTLVTRAVAGGPPEPPSELDTAIEAFETAARQYFQQYDRPAVLVIDNAEKLAREGPPLQLMDHVAQWADQAIARVIFISSDDAFIRWLSGPPPCSPASGPLGHLCTARYQVRL